jgi:RND family efflux transporter MFP subunit
VAVAQEVTATSSALPDRSFTGKVSAIDNRIDETSRTLKVEAELPNDADALKAGMSVVVVLGFPGEARPMVPSMAVQWDRKGSFVWKRDGDEVHRVPITVLSRNSGSVTVVGGLQKGDAVVVEGVQRLREGVKVSDAADRGLPAAPAAMPAASRPGGDG